MQDLLYTPLAVISRARNSMLSVTATDGANSDVSSNEGIVISAVQSFMNYMHI
jgi:hypothetical protein